MKKIRYLLVLLSTVLLIASCQPSQPSNKAQAIQQPTASAQPVTSTNASVVTAVESTPEKEAVLPDPYKDTSFPEVSFTKTYTPEKQNIYYEIFVRSFADSDGNGIGDLNGVTQNLDYISDLGATAIWLMPINPSPSYHGYDPTDYYGINPDYGTMDDFKNLVAEAKKRNIDVIIDMVANHTSSQHPWFLDSAKLSDSPYRYFYRWTADGDPGYNVAAATSTRVKVWHKRQENYFYGIFWDGMPDLNYDNPDVRAEIKKVAQYWLNTGISGFRLDAAQHIYAVGETYDSTKKNLRQMSLNWWKEFAKACQEINPNTYLVSEIWENPDIIAPFFSVFDSSFNFSLETQISNVLNSGFDINGGFANTMEKAYALYKKADPDMIDAPFISSHDVDRVFSRLSGSVEKAKLAASIYLTLPGNPFIYYGEEIGMAGKKPDERIREPFIWSGGKDPRQTSWEPVIANKDTVPYDIQKEDPDSLYNHYKALISLRKSNPVIMSGDFKPIDTGNNAIVGYTRFNTDGKTAYILHNVGKGSQTLTLTDIDLTGFKVLYKSGATNSFNNNTVTFESQSSVILIN